MYSGSLRGRLHRFATEPAPPASSPILSSRSTPCAISLKNALSSFLKLLAFSFLCYARARHLLKTLIERYIAEGQPVGSRTLSKDSELELSPATIRNVMADLEDAG